MRLQDPQRNSKEQQVNTTKDTNQEDMENVSRSQGNHMRSDDSSFAGTNVASPTAARCQEGEEEVHSTTTSEEEGSNTGQQQDVLIQGDASILELEQEILMERYLLMKKYIVIKIIVDYLKSHQVQ